MRCLIAIAELLVHPCNFVSRELSGPAFQCPVMFRCMAYRAYFCCRLSKAYSAEVGLERVHRLHCSKESGFSWIRLFILRFYTCFRCEPNWRAGYSGVYDITVGKWKCKHKMLLHNSHIGIYCIRWTQARYSVRPSVCYIRDLWSNG